MKNLSKLLLIIGLLSFSSCEEGVVVEECQTATNFEECSDCCQTKGYNRESWSALRDDKCHCID